MTRLRILLALAVAACGPSKWEQACVSDGGHVEAYNCHEWTQVIWHRIGKTSFPQFVPHRDCQYECVPGGAP